MSISSPKENISICDRNFSNSSKRPFQHFQISNSRLQAYAQLTRGVHHREVRQFRLEPLNSHAPGPSAVPASAFVSYTPSSVTDLDVPSNLSFQPQHMVCLC